MKERILGRLLSFSLRIIDAWPGSDQLYSRIFIWIFMIASIWFQSQDIFDTTDDLTRFMESSALTISHVLSFIKVLTLWGYDRQMKFCFEMLEEDWKNVKTEEDLAVMERHAKFARYSCVFIFVCYYSTCMTFMVTVLVDYVPGDPNYERRELASRAKYPFDFRPSPVYEFIIVLGVLQSFSVAFGNFMADSFLIALVAHASGQLIILHGRIRRLSKISEVSAIVKTHRKIIDFADHVRFIFRWIGMNQFLQSSVIICALGYMVIMHLETDIGGYLVLKFVNFIIAMIFGVFIYGCTGNVLIEESVAVHDAVYESHWTDLPSQPRTMLSLMMMRARKPLCITAGDFFAMNYESFVAFQDIFDNTDDLTRFMESSALIISHVLSFIKVLTLWGYDRQMKFCFEMLEEDWKNVKTEEDLAVMERHAKFARYSCVFIFVCYYSTCMTFMVTVLVDYVPGDPNYERRELASKAKYPFDFRPSPVYEFIIVLGVLQSFSVAFGNFMADSFLIALVAHASGQLIILHGRIRRLSKISEVSAIVKTHRKIIDFADHVRFIFRWIGMNQFLQSSVIICALGYMVIMHLETDIGGYLVLKFVNFIIAMIFGVFIYGCTGNVLIEESVAVHDAVYESHWTDLPSQPRTMLSLMMMRARKPLCITAGDFFAMNYESFVAILKTSASYLSVIRAAKE